MSTLLNMAEQSDQDAFRVATLTSEQHACYANQRSWWVTVWRLVGLADDNGKAAPAWFGSPEEARTFCKTEHIYLNETEETTC